MILLISESKYCYKIQPYLNKLFEGIDNLIYEDIYIKGISSEMGENLLFNNTINMEMEIYVEERLKYVELYMMNAIEKQIHDCYKIFKEIDLKQLIGNYPQQILQVVNEINWTEFIETSLNREEYMETFIDTDNIIKEKLLLLKLDDLNELTKHKLKNLILLDLNKRDLKYIKNINDFKWATQLKHKLINNVYIIKFMQTQIKYMYEYLGNINEIVLTPFTDRCIRTLINTYYLHMNGLLRGNTQSGKLTTIKNLSNIFGVMLINFNCINYLNYEIIQNLINGIITCGCWLLLKNIDNLTCEFLSIFTQYINQVKINKNVNSIDLKIQQQTYFLTATINNEKFILPEYINCLFRTSILLMPELKIIVQILLKTQGFHNTEMLSKKIITTLNLMCDLVCVENGTFGIKTVKLILSECELLKRKYSNMNETVIIVKSIENVIKRQLTIDDTNMFESIIKSTFQLENSCLNHDDVDNDVDEQHLVEIINSDCKKYNLDPKQSFVMKIVQTLDLIKSQYGQILVGETYSGKSTAIKICSRIFAQQQYNNNRNEIKQHIINIKCLTYKQLYGNFNSITQQWEDGILTKICRQNEYNWILLDGQPNYLCIENINSILDEKKILYLNCGERIFINQIKFFIEIDHLNTFSPAMVLYLYV